MQLAPDTPSPAPEYHTYVLRQWRESNAAPWRYSLQVADGTERLGFASLDQLVAYLQQHEHPPGDSRPLNAGPDDINYTPKG